jgi:hypothetical protein
VSAVGPLATLTVTAALCYGLHRLNRRKGWFRIGELIFWDVVILIVVGLVSLQWW